METLAGLANIYSITGPKKVHRKILSKRGSLLRRSLFHPKGSTSKPLYQIPKIATALHVLHAKAQDRKSQSGREASLQILKGGQCRKINLEWSGWFTEQFPPGLCSLPSVHSQAPAALV